MNINEPWGDSYSDADDYFTEISDDDEELSDLGDSDENQAT